MFIKMNVRLYMGLMYLKTAEPIGTKCYIQIFFENLIAGVFVFSVFNPIRLP